MKTYYPAHMFAGLHVYVDGITRGVRRSVEAEIQLWRPLEPSRPANFGAVALANDGRKFFGRFAPPGHGDGVDRRAGMPSLYLHLHAHVGKAVNLQHCGIDDIPLKIGADSVGVRLDGHHLAEFLDAERLDAAVHIPAQRQGLVKGDGVAGAHGAVDFGPNAPPAGRAVNDGHQVAVKGIAKGGARAEVLLRHIEKLEEATDNDALLAATFINVRYGGDDAGEGD